MSGLGRKVFEANDILTAADVNGYLMDQAVMVFADASARSSAIPAPTAGMVSYRTDGTVIEYYDGSAWEAVSNPGDITAVTAGTALSGGGNTGDVTLNVDLTAIQIDGTQVGYTLTSSTATSYTLMSSDANKYLQFTNPATITVSTATDFSVGDQVTIIADGTATNITTDGATIAGGGTSTTSGSVTTGDSAFTAISILCVASDDYRVIGSISAV